MNKKIKLFATLLLLLLFLYISYTSLHETISISIFPNQDSIDISAQLSFSDTQHSISAYHNGTNEFYLFLPSYALGKDISFTLGDNITLVSCNESEQKVLSEDLSYLINDNYTLHVLVGSDIPTVFLDLKHDLSYITSDKDKQLSDSGQATFLSTDGSIIHMDTLEEFRGRGNVTWDMDKKPFTISLENSVSLYDMPVSNDYCLITSYDYSFMRNRLSDELASVMDLAFMQRQHINLYINGAYQGVYELCEKITADTLEIVDLETASKESIKASPSLTQMTSGEFLPDWNNTTTGKWWSWENDHLAEVQGGYILETDMTLRYEEEASGFTLDSGAYMVCKEPTYLSQAQYECISTHTRQCEDLLYQAFESGSLDSLSEYMDIPSFIAKYLVEEVSKNLDSSTTSQYFYISNDGLLAAGPVWDYDHAYGCHFEDGDINFLSPEGFSARNVTGTFVWWQLLYYQKDFYQEMVTTYNNTLYPFLSDLTNTKITEWEDHLIDSAVMDYIRWNRASSEEEARKRYHNEVNSVSDFLHQRSEFLYNEWNS